MNGRAGLRRVVKVGGSLFDQPTWVVDVERWIAGQPQATTLIVVGGGQAADDVFTEQRATGISDAEAHWKCIRSMGRHALWLALRKEWPVVSDPRELDDSSPGSTIVIEAHGFMESVDALLGLGALPESWDVSSDSIAARAAELFAANELVLLKSKLPDDVDQLGDYVDPYFVEASRKVTVIRFVNLRDPAFPEVRWR